MTLYVTPAPGDPGFFVVVEGRTTTTDRTFTYRDITVGVAGPFYLQRVDGWAAIEASFEDVAVSGGHGSLVTPPVVKAKTVTLSGQCVSKRERDTLFWALRNAAAAGIEAGEATSPLTGDVGGVVLTADAQVSRWQATVEQAHWNRGLFGWDIEFRMSDPRFYGPQVTQRSFLATPGAGISSPLAPPVTIPDNPVGGQLAVVNEGSASAAATYTLTGPLVSPGVLVNAGTSRQVRVQYDLSLAEGDSLVVSTLDGGAGFLNGAYRTPNADSDLTADLMIRPGSNTVQALGMAGPGSPGSSITVTFRPAYW